MFRKWRTQIQDDRVGSQWEEGLQFLSESSKKKKKKLHLKKYYLVIRQAEYWTKRKQQQQKNKKPSKPRLKFLLFSISHSKTKTLLGASAFQPCKNKEKPKNSLIFKSVCVPSQPGHRKFKTAPFYCKNKPFSCCNFKQLTMLVNFAFMAQVMVVWMYIKKVAPFPHEAKAIETTWYFDIVMLNSFCHILFLLLLDVACYCDYGYFHEMTHLWLRP